MVASMWAEEQELQGRTSRPRIVNPARQRWATPDVLDGIGMWHDDQPYGPRWAVTSSRLQAEESGLPAKRAAALAGRLRPVEVGFGALSRSESAGSPSRASAPALHAVPGMWDERNCDIQQHRPAPGTYHAADLLQWRRAGWSEGGRTPSRLQARNNAICADCFAVPPPATPGVGRVGAGRAFIRPSRGQARAVRWRRCAAPRRPPAAGVCVWVRVRACVCVSE
jgi:hypothetical protein